MLTCTTADDGVPAVLVITRPKVCPLVIVLAEVQVVVVSVVEETESPLQPPTLTPLMVSAI